MPRRRGSARRCNGVAGGVDGVDGVDDGAEVEHVVGQRGLAGREVDLDRRWAVATSAIRRTTMRPRPIDA